MALGFSADLLAALEYLHSKGVPRCDIKPDNTLINDHYGAVLTDLGAAKERITAAGTGSGGVVGDISLHGPKALRQLNPLLRQGPL